MAKVNRVYDLVSRQSELLPFSTKTLWEMKEYIKKTYSKNLGCLESSNAHIATVESIEDGNETVVGITPIRIERGEIKFGRTTKAVNGLTIMMS